MKAQITKCSLLLGLFVLCFGFASAQTLPPELLGGLGLPRDDSGLLLPSDAEILSAEQNSSGPVILTQPTAPEPEIAADVSVDVIWEADSYVPPLYKGRALYTSGTNVTFYAVLSGTINGRRATPGDLYYQWRQDGIVLGSKSGVGQESLIILGDILSSDLDIEVELQTSDGNIVAGSRIDVPIEEARLVLYQNSPTLGQLSDVALFESMLLQEEETVVDAVPYFYAAQDPIALNFAWSTGGITDSQTFRKTGEGGSETVSVSVKNPEILTQYEDETFTITF